MSSYPDTSKLVQWVAGILLKAISVHGNDFPMYDGDCGLTDTLLSTKLNVLSAHLSCSWIPHIPSVISISPDTGHIGTRGGKSSYTN